jgi:hypothetical protein
LGFKEEFDSFTHHIPTDSSYVFWFRMSRELLGLDEDVVGGIVYMGTSENSLLN